MLRKSRERGSGNKNTHFYRHWERMILGGEGVCGTRAGRPRKRGEVKGCLIQNVPDEKAGQAVIQHVLVPVSLKFWFKIFKAPAFETKNATFKTKSAMFNHKECYIQPQRVLCSCTLNVLFMGV